MREARFKQTEIRMIPEGWSEIRLSDIIEIIGGGTPKTTVSEYWGGDIPWLSVVDFNNDLRKVYTTEKTITEEGLKNSSTRILKKGEIIISARGTVGVIAQLGRDMAFNQSCYGLRAKQNTTNDFVYYLLKHAVNKLKISAHGSVFDTITRDTFDLIDVLFPPISEQQIITEILGALDDKIALNRSMNSTLESIGQALFKHWFVDFEFPDGEGKPYRSSGGEMAETELGEVPRGWRVVSFDEIVEVRGGSTPKTENPTYWNGDIPWITPKDLTTSDRIHFSKTSRYITQAGLESISKNLIPSGSVLLSSRAPIGYVAINDVPMATNQGFINIICSDQINYLFLYYWLKFSKELLLSFANGTTFQELSKSSFKKIKLILPHQTQMNLFKAIISPMDLQIANNHDEIEQISLIRDALLPKLMSGEIRVKKTEKFIEDINNNNICSH